MVVVEEGALGDVDVLDALGQLGDAILLELFIGVGYNTPGVGVYVVEVVWIHVDLPVDMDMNE